MLKKVLVELLKLFKYLSQSQENTELDSNFSAFKMFLT